MASATTTVTPHKEVSETFWHVFVRRARYVAAVVVSGMIFHYLAMGLARPPAEYSGVSLLAWDQPVSHVALTLLSLCVLVSLGIVISMALTHPDSPHAGMYCAMLGMAIVSIRGGTADMMLAVFQQAGNEKSLYQRLGFESLLLLIVVLAATYLSYAIYGRYFVNSQWARRLVHTDGQFVELQKPGVLPAGMISYADKADSAPAVKFAEKLSSTIGAMVLTMLIGSVLLYVFVQSQAKGQVLFGAYVSFGVAAGVAYAVFPKSPFWAYWLAVPLTTAVGFFISKAQGDFVVPGHAASAVARGVPLDYIVAGVPGAIHGVYTALKWRTSATLHDGRSEK